MSYHVWRAAPADWGCTKEVGNGEQCGQPAVMACQSRHDDDDDCDQLEARCKHHVTRADFRPPLKPRHCRYCRSAKHFGDRYPTRTTARKTRRP